MMKKLFSAALFACALVFCSCDAISGVKLTDQESVDKKLRKKIEEVAKADDIIYEVSMGSTGDFTVSMDVVVVTFSPTGSDEKKRYNLTVPGNQKPRETKVMFDMERRTSDTGIKLSELDFSKIAMNVNTAAAMLQAENMPMDGVAHYNIEIDGNPENTLHKFALESKEGTDFGSKNGRAALVTNYYEVEFSADAAGSVTMVE